MSTESRSPASARYKHGSIAPLSTEVFTDGLKRDAKPNAGAALGTIKDDRDGLQAAQTHTTLIGGRDSFMSGWGGAEGGSSYAYWACEDRHIDKVKEWVESRSDIASVRVCLNVPNPGPSACVHIYIVKDGHPALAD